MIRTLSSILGILALALVCVAAGGTERDAAAAATPHVSVTSSEAPVGGEVTVSIEGESGDATIGAFTIDLVYNPAVAVARECTTTLLALCEPQTNNHTARVAGIALGGLKGHFEFVEVTFDVVGAPGTSTVLDVRVVELADLASANLVPQTEVTDGQISVLGGGGVVLKGDADCDGEISSADALSILRDVAGASFAPCGEAGDVDCDGELTSADSLRVLRYVASLPFTTPGGCPPIGESA